PCNPGSEAVLAFSASCRLWVWPLASPLYFYFTRPLTLSQIGEAPEGVTLITPSASLRRGSRFPRSCALCWPGGTAPQPPGWRGWRTPRPRSRRRAGLGSGLPCRSRCRSRSGSRNRTFSASCRLWVWPLASPLYFYFTIPVDFESNRGGPGGCDLDHILRAAESHWLMVSSMSWPSCWLRNSSSFFS